MIYLDSSVVLARLFVEGREPPAAFWEESLFSSRLLEYEVWIRLNARQLSRSYANAASAVINRVTLIELTPEVLERALEPFPLPVRTLDALHLATIDFLQRLKQDVYLATYDRRLASGAEALQIRLVPL